MEKERGDDDDDDCRDPNLVSKRFRVFLEERERETLCSVLS